MTKMKDQPWYNPYLMKKYPKKGSRYSGFKFVPGEIYISEPYHGSGNMYLCVKRSESGFVFFKRYYVRGTWSSWGDEVIRRKPYLVNNSERVDIIKPTFGRVCWTGGERLSATYKYKDKKTHKVPAPFGL